MPQAADDIAWLMQWYAAQCDGDWEHSFGIKIDSLDNPGWWIEIDLAGTKLEGRNFEAVESNVDKSQESGLVRWHSCRVKDAKFDGAGGVFDLVTIIGIFREWVERGADQ